MKFKSFEELGQIKEQFKVFEETDSISNIEEEKSNKEKNYSTLELEDETSGKIRVWSDTFFQDIYNNKIDLGFIISGTGSIIYDTISEISENEDEKLKNTRLKKGLSIFIETMINFVEEKSADINEREKLNTFINKIQESMFSFSPNIFNSIYLEDMIVLSAKANRVPEIQGWFGQTMVGEIVYELNWPPENIENKIVSKILKSRTAEIFDILEQLEVTGARASGEMYDASNAFEKVVNIVNSIKIHKNSPVINYISELVLERLGSEENNPSLSFITYNGNKEHSRLSKQRSEDMNKENYKISHQINPDIHIDGLILPIASDAIASFDHSNTPRHFSVIDYKELESPQNISILPVKKVLDVFENNFNNINERGAINFINKTILGPLGEKEIVSFKEYGVENIKSKLIEINSDLENKLTPTHFEKYNSIPNNKTLNPFVDKKEDNQFGLLLQHLHKPELKNKIEQDLQINLNEIPLRSQIHFLKFLSNSDGDKFNKLKIVLRGKTIEQNTNFLKSFLSMSGNNEMGDKILILGEKLPKEIAREIFAKYGEIINIVDSVEKYLSLISDKKDDFNDPKIIQEIKEKLLIRGKELLSDCSEGKIDGILESLDSLKLYNEFFCAFLKSLKDNKVKTDLFKFKDIHLETIFLQETDTSSVHENQKQKSDMINIISKNYKDTPDLANKLARELADIFDGKGKNRTTIDMLKNKDEILAFCRFEEIGDKKLYFGSFNVEKDMRGLLIGDSFLEATLNKKSKDNKIIAVCHAANRIGAYYIENGFIADKFTPDYSGIPILSINRNDLKNETLFKTKLLSVEEIKKIENTDNIKVFNEKNQEELISKLDKVNEGYVLTRYFNDPETKDWYIVLEKFDSNSLE